jgi:hypothetical protein
MGLGHVQGEGVLQQFLRVFHLTHSTHPVLSYSPISTTCISSTFALQQLVNSSLASLRRHPPLWVSRSIRLSLTLTPQHPPGYPTIPPHGLQSRRPPHGSQACAPSAPSVFYHGALPRPPTRMDDVGGLQWPLDRFQRLEPDSRRRGESLLSSRFLCHIGAHRGACRASQPDGHLWAPKN